MRVTVVHQRVENLPECVWHVPIYVTKVMTCLNCTQRGEL